ncbi:MAG: hypothetical protein MUF01_17845 [Bryobacterales bacterium]|nr:hypothetical protein [Bryobacterales bacterium]
MPPTMLSFVRAARGPVQLMVLGAVFLLAYGKVADISKTWPVLLISYGLMRLLEWTMQRSQPVTEPWQGN